MIERAGTDLIDLAVDRNSHNSRAVACTCTIIVCIFCSSVKKILLVIMALMFFGYLNGLQIYID